VCFGECAVAIVTGKPVRNAPAVGTPLSIFGLLYRSWRSAVDTVRCGKSRRVDSILGASGRYYRGACGRVDCQGTILLNSFGSFAILAAIHRG
jgi:hypothetical protein